MWRIVGMMEMVVACSHPDVPATESLQSLQFTVQPGDTAVGAAIAPGIVVNALDASGQVMPDVLVTMAIGTNAHAGAVLSGTLSVPTDGNGNATFGDLSIDWLGLGYTLVATAGTLDATSDAFEEVRVGEPCLGPQAACAGGCPDSDGDGLGDAWEIAGGIDLNGDAMIDDHDIALAGADPARQDVFVQYDWMDYAPPGNPCDVDGDCGAISGGHSGEVCSGPKVVVDAAGSCVFACAQDADCAARGIGHATERCTGNVCVHTHDPDVLAPQALPAVVASFAAHQIVLHLVRGHAVPHSEVVSYRESVALSEACEGGSVAAGTAGPGLHVASFYELKQASTLDPLNLAYHYALFGHYSGCDTAAHCMQCPPALNPDGSVKNAPSFGESGLAEVSGNDLVVSLGQRHQDLRHEPGVFDVGTTFMHELGHNLGLRHGGDDDINAKPNYLSVMNYRYQFTGIQSAATIGGTTAVGSRVDFSAQTLPTAGNTPGLLDQSTVVDQPVAGDPGLGLSELAGLGGGTADLFTFTSGAETGVPVLAPVEGAVDWNGNGNTLDTNVQSDTTCGPEGFGDHLCTLLQYPQLHGHTDWTTAGGNAFTYAFQCTPFGGPDGDGAARWTSGELTTAAAITTHADRPMADISR